MVHAAQFWDAQAEKYAKQPIANEAAYDATLDRTRYYLDEGQRVLEVGCGTGTTALRLCDNVREYVGSDFSSGMIRIASEKAFEKGARNVAFKTAAVGEIADKNTPFDAVLGFNLLHLLPTLDEDLKRIASVLKPGGLFISKTFCGLGPKAPLKWRLMKIALPILQALGKAPYVRFQREAELREQIEAHGFEILETRHFVTDVSVPFIVARKIA
ncbi:class I SAM-dependent methyltransferase [Methyloceanibacter sp. wino2]|uniref:class I SAM-dependent methyltransferase n=1 Tax=Methyloceanibacter sp. wino2 TaxID=2170729 RepID=UPI000D3E4D3C|nr:class I SAM-dependent methyltransferase [Methyloceanibacter sp. wino2]